MFFYLTTTFVPNRFSAEHYEPIPEPAPAIAYPHLPHGEGLQMAHGQTVLFGGAHEARYPFTPLHL